MEYLKKDGENDFDYLMRLVGIKIEDKPDDLDWSDIVKYCDLNCHYDSLRKAMQPPIYGAYAIYKQLINSRLNKVSTKTQLDEIREKVGELFVVKKQIQTEKTELNKIKNTFVKSFTLAEQLEKIMYDNNFKVIVPEYCNTKINVNSQYEMLVHISDWHIGYVINNCKGNYYNWDIANERIDKLIDECNKYINMYNVKKVYVVNTGDIIEHVYMRENQSQFCEFNQSEQINKSIDLIHRFLCALCKNANVEYDSIYGNHDRFNGDKSANLDGDNAEVIIREQLAKYRELSNNQRLEVINRKHTDKEIRKKINGVHCKFIHGEGSCKDGKKAIKNEISMDNEFYDILFKGHLHNFNIESENNGRYIIHTGCLSGYNDYSVRFGCTSVASQTICIFDKNKIEMIKDIQLN